MNLDFTDLAQYFPKGPGKSKRSPFTPYLEEAVVQLADGDWPDILIPVADGMTTETVKDDVRDVAVGIKESENLSSQVSSLRKEGFIIACDNAYRTRKGVKVLRYLAPLAMFKAGQLDELIAERTAITPGFVPCWGPTKDGEDGIAVVHIHVTGEAATEAQADSEDGLDF